MIKSEKTEDAPIRTVPVSVSEVPLWRARLGMIDLASGLTGEEQMHAILPDDVLLLTSRVRNSNEIALGTLSAMQGDLRRAVSTIVPEEEIDAMLYCCTSGTIAMGEDTVARLVQDVRPGVPVTNPFSASVAAFDRLGVRNIAMVTPYIVDVARAMFHAFEDRGIRVRAATTYDLALDSEICQVSMECIRTTACGQDLAGAEALFIGCTGLRVAHLIEEIEQNIGVPVVTSNQAMAWHALSLAGYGEEIGGFGTLMRHLGAR